MAQQTDVIQSHHGLIRQNMNNHQNPLQHMELKNVLDCPATCTFKNMNTFGEHFHKDSKHLLAEGGQSNIYTFVANDKQLVIGKEYDTSQKENALQLVCTEFKLVTNTKLLLYDDVYYDERQQTALIISEPLNYTLTDYVEIQNKNIHISEKECKLMALDIMDKLWTLHKCGFIHNDLRPDNIMYRNGDYCKNKRDNVGNIGWKIIDYGLILSHEQCNKNKYKYFGTRGWTPPEIMPETFNNKYSYAKDIWSIGLIILYILCKTQPYLLSGYEQSVVCKRDKYKYKQYFYYHKLLQLPLNKKRMNSNGNNKFKKFMRKQFKKSNEGNVAGKKKKNKNIDFKSGELYLKKYLMNLYQTNKISYDLCNLLSNYILTFDPVNRLNLAQIYKHKWFNDVRHL